MLVTGNRRTGGVLLPLVFLALFAVAPFGPAQATPPAAPAPTATKAADLAERFPPGTLLVVRMKNLQETGSWFTHHSPFGRMVDDPEIKPLWDQVSGMIQNARAETKKEIGVDLFAMAGQMKGEMAFGITRFQFAGMMPSVGMLLAVDCRDGVEAFKKDLGALLDRIPEGTFNRTEREVKGTTVQTFSPVRSNNRRRDPLPAIGAIHMTWLGSTLVVGNDKAGFDRFLLASRGDDQTQTLGQTENWRGTMARLQGAGDFTLFVDLQTVSELIESFIGLMPDQIGPVIAALGLDEFPALAWTATFAEGDLVHRMLLRYTGDGKSGLGALMAFKKTDLTIPSWIPEDAMQVMLLNYDMAQAFTGLSGLIQDAGEEIHENFQEGLEMFRTEFGLSLQDDLLAALGGPIVMASFARPPRAATEDQPTRDMLNSPFAMQAPTLIGFPIKNRRTLERFFEIFETAEAEVTEYKGATIYSAPSFDGEDPMVEAAITDRYVLVAFGGGKSLVRSALQRMGGNETGFAGLEAVRNAIAGLPREGVGLAVTNYGKSLSYQLNMMKTLATLFPDVRILAKFPMPSSAVVEKYIGYGADIVTFQPGVGLMSESRWQFKKP